MFLSSFQNDKGSFGETDDVLNCSSTIFFLSALEVERELHKTKNSSPGVDLVPAWVLREFSPFLCEALSHIFNSSLSTCLYPAIFKHAIISPIPKISNPTVTDFRPISLLPLVSKTFERLVMRKWFVPLTIGKLDNMQFAFTPGVGKGCTSALALVQHKILKFLDESSGAVRVLLVDLSKAFDCATLSSTVRALSRLQLPQPLIYWTSNYMQGRFQAVRVETETSDWSDVTSGVPQGSVLGPFLFATIVDDLQPKHPNSSLVKYADDLTVLHFIRNPSEDRLEEEWKNIKDWCGTTQLHINPKKTKILDIITSKRMPECARVSDNGVFIETVQTARILGVTFSSDLRWDAHVHDVVSRASRRLFSLIILRNSGASPKALWQFYCASIQSILLYAHPAWCNCSKGLWDTMLKVERRALRIIGSLESTSLRQSSDSLCLRLMKKIAAKVDHPLSEIIVRVEQGNTRAQKTVTSHWAKTSRFRDSLTKYADKI
jgi:hypothetical protein